MKILGIDPGTNILGFAMVQASSTVTVIEHGVFHTKSHATHHEKLYQIFQKVIEIINTFNPDEMAVEAPFYGKNVQSMLKLGRAQGVAIAAAMHCDLSVREYSPKKIKLAVTGNGNASKEQVSAMVYQLIDNKVKREILDATDALATAICHHFQRKNPLSGGANYKDWNAFLKENPERFK